MFPVLTTEEASRLQAEASQCAVKLQELGAPSVIIIFTSPREDTFGMGWAWRGSPYEISELTRRWIQNAEHQSQASFIAAAMPPHES
jgi:hypothetical protein